MRRVLAWFRLVVGLALEVVVLTARSVVHAVDPHHASNPAILELVLRLTSDRELSWMAMSIAITPGSLVLGTAAPRPGEPARMYVHVLHSQGRADDVAALRGLEDRIMAVTRGTGESR